MGAADREAVSRLRSARAAAAVAGIRRKRSAEHSANVRAEGHAWIFTCVDGTSEPDVLAPANRSKEAGICGLVPVQRRPGRRPAPAGSIAGAEPCGGALFEDRSQARS